jgi:thiol-disulfide isomerase/thioredoxin
MVAVARAALILAVLPALPACGTASSRDGAPARLPAAAPAAGLAAIDPPAAAGAMGANLAVAGADVLMTWLEPAAGAAPSPVTGRMAHQLRFARLSGGRWSAPTTIALGEAIVANWADFPSIVAGPGGSLVAHWAQASGDEPYAYDVELARSTDGGATWRRLGKAHDDGTTTEHGFVSLIAEGDAVRAFWLDGRDMAGGGHDGHDGHGGGAMTLRTARVSGRISDGERLDPRVCECCGTSAAMTSDGPVVVFRDRSDAEVRDISIVRRVDGRWTEPRTIHADGWTIQGCPVNGPAVAARGRQVVVAWFTHAADRPVVRAAFSRDAGATFEPPVEVDAPSGRRTPLGRVAVALDDRGEAPAEAIVSWVDAEREAARVMLRRVAADRRLGAPLEVARTTATRDSGFPRLALAGGAAVVSWTDTADGSRVRAARIGLDQVPDADAPAPAIAVAPVATAEVFPLGSSAPDYAAVTLDGKPVSLGALRGGVVLVNLWATWCEPCRHEMPELATLHARHAGQLRVIGVSVDQQKTAAELRRFVERRKLPFEFWHDPEDRATDRFGLTTLPATLLFDRRGVLVWHKRGAITADEPGLAAAIAAALAP